MEGHSNSFTLAVQSTGASVLGLAQNRVVGSTFTVGPNQTIKRGQFKVAKSTAQPYIQFYRYFTPPEVVYATE
jgi:hypothetical protein